jgi:hypothetical protein
MEMENELIEAGFELKNETIGLYTASGKDYRISVGTKPIKMRGPDYGKYAVVVQDNYKHAIVVRKVIDDVETAVAMALANVDHVMEMTI